MEVQRVFKASETLTANHWESWDANPDFSDFTTFLLSLCSVTFSQSPLFVGIISYSYFSVTTLLNIKQVILRNRET